MSSALENVGRRKVRSVAAEHSAASDALFKQAARGKVQWTVPEWNLVLAALDSCDLSVSDWLMLQ